MRKGPSVGALGNTPRRTTVLTLEARKSFAFGLKFLTSSTDAPVDLTGAAVRLVLAQPAHLGGAALVTKTATAVDLPLGLVQFELQAAELDLTPGEYPFTVTLVSALGYSTVIVKGVVDLAENTDGDDTNTYAGINPSTNLAAYLENGGLVEVTVDHLDGMYVIVEQRISQFESDAAATQAAHVAEVTALRDQAATSATNANSDRNAASTSASNAAASQTAAASSAAAAAASQSAASTSAANAEAAKTNAEASASSAESSATAAAGSAGTASTKASEASTSAINAASSASDADTSASNAATSETNAANSAAASQSSADASAASAAQAEAVVTGDLDPSIAEKATNPATQTYAALTTRIQDTAPATHLHDDRYYTEAETDALLSAKSGSSHLHDDRYYTETEADARFATDSHTHDSQYYTETETDGLLAGKSNTGHTHTKSNITDFAHNHTKAEITDFAHNHAASEITSGTVEAARLGSGTADSTKFLRGDNTWATVQSGPVTQTHPITYGTPVVTEALTRRQNYPGDWFLPGVDNVGLGQDSDGRIWSVGGGRGAATLYTTYMYDPAKPADGWIKQSSFPQTRENVVVVGTANHIYAIGGSSNDRVYQLNRTTGAAWVEKSGRTPTTLSGGFGVADPTNADRIYVFPATSQQTWRYTISTDSWSNIGVNPPAQFDRGAAYGFYNGELWAYSGRSGVFASFNFTTTTWTSRHTLNASIRREFGFGGVSGNRFYLLGGVISTVTSSTVSFYDMDLGTYSASSVVLPYPKRSTIYEVGSVTSSADGCIYMLAGTGFGQQLSSDESDDFFRFEAMTTNPAPLITATTSLIMSSHNPNITLRNTTTGVEALTVAATSGQSIVPAGLPVRAKTATSVTASHTGS